MIKINLKDIAKRLPHVYDWQHSLLKKLPAFLFVGNFCVAGGAVRSLLEGKKDIDGDIDIYTFSQQDKTELATALISSGFKEVAHTEWSRTFNGNGIDVQIMEQIYVDENDVIQSFDFTVTQGAYTPDKDEFTFGFWTFSDVNTKTLTINKLKHSDKILGRLAKYCNYGYEPTHDTLTQIYEFIRLSPSTKVSPYYRRGRKYLY